MTEHTGTTLDQRRAGFREEPSIRLVPFPYPEAQESGGRVTVA
jgi:hypothetical protein